MLHIYRTFEVEATKFLQNGYHDSELGNTMPLAMANALKISFVIFTSLSTSPVFFVTPREPSTEVLYLAFAYCGPGHYDSAIFTGEIVTVKVKCRCGVNTYQHDQENQVACSHQGGRHSSCKRLAAGLHVHLPVAVKVVAIPMGFTQETLESESKNRPCGKR